MTRSLGFTSDFIEDLKFPNWLWGGREKKEKKKNVSAAGRFGSGSSNAISGAADHMRGRAPRPLSGEQLFHLRECRRSSCHLLKSRVQTAEGQVWKPLWAVASLHPNFCHRFQYVPLFNPFERKKKETNIPKCNRSEAEKQQWVFVQHLTMARWSRCTADNARPVTSWVTVVETHGSK